LIAAALLAVGLCRARAGPAPVHKAVRKTAAKPAAADPAPLNANDLMTQARQAQSRGDNELAVRLAQSAIVAGSDRADTYDALAMSMSPR